MKAHYLAEKAAALYESGASIDAVAAELGVAYRTARRALKMGGATLRDPSARLVGRTRPNKRIVHRTPDGFPINPDGTVNRGF